MDKKKYPCPGSKIRSGGMGRGLGHGQGKVPVGGRMGWGEELTKKRALPSHKELMKKGAKVQNKPLKKVIDIKKAKLSDIKGVIKTKR